jgi:hypothetical protein
MTDTAQGGLTCDIKEAVNRMQGTLLIRGVMISTLRQMSLADQIKEHEMGGSM